MNKYVEKDGKVYIKQDDGSEKFLFEDVRIVERVRNLNSKKIVCKIQFKYGGYIVEEFVQRSSLQTKKKILDLQDLGLDVTEENAKNMIEYLKTQEEDVHIITSHSNIGYDPQNNTFNLFKSFPNNSVYDGNLDIKPKGSIHDWLNIYNNEVKDKVELQFMVALAASSAIIGMIGREIEIENPIIHIYGDSSSGKTTGVQLGVSVWGNPNLRSSGLLQNYNGTANAIMHTLRNNNGVSICFDEISMSSLEDFTGFIYATSNGKEKGRLISEVGKGYVNQEQATWNTVIMSTGEYDILEKSKENDGLKVRVYSIGGIQWTKSSENSDNIKRGVCENYGQVGEKFVEILMKYGSNKVKEEYDYCYKNMKKKLQDKNVFDNLTGRRSKYYAIIILTASLLDKYLNLEMDLNGILDLLIDIEGRSISERNVGKQAYKRMLEVVLKNRKKFPIINSKRTKRDTIRDDVWGYVLKNDGEVEIFSQEFKKQCMQLGFQSHTVILNKWKEMGMLNHELDRLDRTRGGAQVYVIKIKDEFLEILFDKNEDSNDDLSILE